jgi:23S rRNA pseudouridine2605 synthase
VSERIQKLLAAAGMGSRRGIEMWLRDGRIQVNGVVAGLGDRASATDTILIDGRAVVLAVPAAGPVDRQVLLYHKPIGEMTTRSDPQGRPTVFERLPPPDTGRWVVVGRLDVNTSGLLLFTNDGELAHRLMHPSFELRREYLVRVRGNPPQSALDAMLRGLNLEDGMANFDELHPAGASEGHSWFRVALHEGRNREVRRLWEAAGYEVSRLKRLAYGPFSLPEDLLPGRWQLLGPEAIATATALVPQLPPGRTSESADSID